MSDRNEETRSSRELTIRRIRSDIQAAQLRVALDEARGRQTPEAVVRLAQLPMPPVPSPFDTLRTPDGKLRTDPASRREMALHVRRNILAAQLRVALDEARGRPTPEAVKRLAQKELPTLSLPASCLSRAAVVGSKCLPQEPRTCRGGQPPGRTASWRRDNSLTVYRWV